MPQIYNFSPILSSVGVPNFAIQLYFYILDLQFRESH